MPLIKIFTSGADLPAERADRLLRDLSTTLAEQLNKPEAYVMTCLMPAARMTFGGSEAPTCYAEVKNVGDLSASKTAELSRVLSSLISEALAVRRDRVYLEFSSVAAHLWGWNGETFA